jgi:hypothetical protein
VAANTQVECPKCKQKFGLRFDPGPEDAAPAAAVRQLDKECLNHEGKQWEFWKDL